MAAYLSIAMFLLAISSSYSQECVFETTQCTCALQSAGNICLRLIDGTLGFDSSSPQTGQCTAYTCREGYTCDCIGTMMCSVSQLCPGNPQSYIPVDSTEGVSVNDVVSCAQQIGRSCITPMETTTVIPTTSPTASPSSSPTSSPTPSPARTCVSDTTIRMNEFVVKPISIATSGSNFEIRGPIGDTFTGKIVYLSSLQSSTSFNGGLLSFTKAEQIETVSGTFDSNGLLQVTIANRFLTYFTVILCSDFQLTTEDEISVLFNVYPVSFSIADPSIFGTIYDVIGSIVGSNPGTNYAIILSGNTYTGTYFTDVASNNYNFYVVFRDSCTLELYAVSTTSNAGTSNIVVGADGNVHGLADFSPDPVDTTFGSINPKLVATT